MKVLQGNLLTLALEGQFDVIVHGCNCQCRMGRGIALAIKEQLPEAYAADQATEKGSRAKLGTISSADVLRGGVRFTVVNAYTQFHWAGEGVLVDYDALGRAFDEIRRRYSGRRIGYPRIGAGLARGDWEKIASIIDAALAGEDHTLVEFVSSESGQLK
ncbi:MAG TPA: phosphatase [Phycisphaerae bacterium]|nr:phosphatase [Phycisphaerae bacterium]